ANFQADVTLYQTPELEILPGRRDHNTFGSLRALADDVNSYGYYGGIRIIKAALKKFHEYCELNEIRLDDRNFSIRYHSSIPAHLGLAGSSAIITACMRALCSYYEVVISNPSFANLVLSVETEELGIGAGLQDRVAQAYQGITYMDFSREIMDRQGYGNYVPLKPSRLPNIYIAYKQDLSEGSEVVHNDLRYRYRNGDQKVIDAMSRFADLADAARDMFESESYEGFSRLMDTNFDLRASICSISPQNREMVECARSVGASAKFTGSGGAIIGTYEDTSMLDRLRTTLHKVNAAVINPEII
ncbi:MAG: GHMP kinase, partial [Candidatus Latescibacteria bacterium]|nr:GHMP kinase [Candidatus Latescibacterota bacterium]